MEEELRALLVADDDLAALVGTRIYWDTKAQGAADPSIVLYLVSDPPNYHMQGPSGHVESRVQVDVRAATRTQAKAVADAVEAALSGYRGIIGNIRFQGIFKDGRSRSSYEDTTAEKFFRRSHDYTIHSGLAA